MVQYLLNKPITVEELSDLIVIFYDCGCIEEPDMKKYIQWLRDNLLIRGRHINTRIILYISHMISI